MLNSLAYLIPIVAIVGGIIYAIFNLRFRTQRQIAENVKSPALVEALATSTATNAAVLLKVGALERRIDELEKSK